MIKKISICADFFSFLPIYYISMTMIRHDVTNVNFAKPFDNFGWSSVNFFAKLGPKFILKITTHNGM